MLYDIFNLFAEYIIKDWIKNIRYNQSFYEIVKIYDIFMNIFKKLFGPPTGREKGGALVIHLDADLKKSI